MSPKNKKGKKLTSTIMALAMTVTTTFQMPIISMASEIESSVAVESQIEEGTSEESVSVQSETTAQTNAEQTNSVIEETSGTTEATNDATQVSDEVQATVAETTAEVTYEEEKTTLSSEVDPSGEDIEESKANETRGPDETIETTTQAAEEETSAEVETESESETTEESTQADPFASLDPTSGLTEEQLGAIDFSSKRLLVAADESVIIDPEHVLSDYAGVYLMQYDTETQAKYAYAYYYNKSEFVDVDTVISVADGDGSANAAVPHELIPKVKGIFAAADLLVAYNNQFDLNFLEEWGIQAIGKKQFDVMLAFAREYGEWNDFFCDYKWQKLGTAAAYYGYHFRAHDSLEDVRATLYIFDQMQHSNKRELFEDYFWEDSEDEFDEEEEW